MTLPTVSKLFTNFSLSRAASTALLAVLATSLCGAVASPAHASSKQGSASATKNVTQTTVRTPGRVTGSVYCVNGTVAVKGWEHDLVRRNPGLSRFHWSPITAARPGVMVFRQPGSEQTTKQYHYSKPKVLNYAEMRAVKDAQDQRAQALSARMSGADVNARVSYNRDFVNQNTQAQMVNTNTSANLSQPASYASSYSSTYSSYSPAQPISSNRHKVHGRLISSH